MPMRRDECLKILARHHTDEIVVPVYQAAFEWRTIKPQALTYLGVGAMGQASSHALGFALGRPDKRVLVLDGDGSLLMNLGSLVTIATVAPRNLVHFVCQNDTYEANGSHPIPGAGRASFAGFARAAGYRSVHEFDDLDAFAARIGAVLQEDGPVFVVLHVVAGEPYPQDFPALHDASLREAFRTALAAS
jgi:phosphonopyruvate decarboxylase